MALRGLQFTCGKRHRPVMMDRLEKENRIGVAIDKSQIGFSRSRAPLKLPPT